mmetsp:Transcript_14638/g.40684  ORF Transcript_14638/g.40684 Transcript_14638/m.40684 type:complete len:238 (+) Transcript_14638:2118-2831(+)
MLPSDVIGIPVLPRHRQATVAVGIKAGFLVCFASRRVDANLVLVDLSGGKGPYVALVEFAQHQVRAGFVEQDAAVGGNLTLVGGEFLPQGVKVQVSEQWAESKEASRKGLEVGKTGKRTGSEFFFQLVTDQILVVPPCLFQLEKYSFRSGQFLGRNIQQKSGVHLVEGVQKVFRFLVFFFVLIARLFGNGSRWSLVLVQFRFHIDGKFQIVLRHDFVFAVLDVEHSSQCCRGRALLR